MIAIGGGGYVPARILRSFLKRPGSPNIPIQAIGLSLYESLSTDPVEAPGTKVTRTQWLDLSSLEMSNLVGKNILIVDEVDDTRTTLEYAVRELEKDVEAATEKLGRSGERTRFSIFVLHVSWARGVKRVRKADEGRRIRINRKRGICHRICWMMGGIWLRILFRMYGYVTRGKLRKLPLIIPSLASS